MIDQLVQKRIALSLLLWLYTASAFCQETQTARAPGDTTLFGDPDCVYWPKIDTKEKQVWLNAILSPINMGYMQREKPSINQFAALSSMAPGAKFVDQFCEVNRDKKAMVGAVKYFEELTSRKEQR
jgi:hypothetical protein